MCVRIYIHYVQYPDFGNRNLQTRRCGSQCHENDWLRMSGGRTYRCQALEFGLGTGVMGVQGQQYPIVHKKKVRD